MAGETGVDKLTISEMEELFGVSLEQESPTAEEGTTAEQSTTKPGATDNSLQDEGKNNTDKGNDVERTKAFADRLKKRTDEEVSKKMDELAKQFGYDSYSELVKAKEKKFITDSGYDAEEIAPVIEKVVKDRIDSDPRMKELEKYRKKEIEDFGKRELAEISELTDGQINDFSQLPKEVLDVWQQTGSLKSAYLQVEGENLIRKSKSANTKGSTAHMNLPGGSTNPAPTERVLNREEKEIYRIFCDNVSDEELDKITINIGGK